MAVFVIDKFHVCKIPNYSCIVILIWRFIRKFFLRIRFDVVMYSYQGNDVLTQKDNS